MSRALYRRTALLAAKRSIACTWRKQLSAIGPLLHVHCWRITSHGSRCSIKTRWRMSVIHGQQWWWLDMYTRLLQRDPCRTDICCFPAISILWEIYIGRKTVHARSELGIWMQLMCGRDLLTEKAFEEKSRNAREKFFGWWRKWRENCVWRPPTYKFCFALSSSLSCSVSGRSIQIVFVATYSVCPPLLHNSIWQREYILIHICAIGHGHPICRQADRLRWSNWKRNAFFSGVAVSGARYYVFNEGASQLPPSILFFYLILLYHFSYYALCWLRSRTRAKARAAIPFVIVIYSKYFHPYRFFYCGQKRLFSIRRDKVHWGRRLERLRVAINAIQNKRR